MRKHFARAKLEHLFIQKQANRNRFNLYKFYVSVRSRYLLVFVDTNMRPDDAVQGPGERICSPHLMRPTVAFLSWFHTN